MSNLISTCMCSPSRCHLLLSQPHSSNVSLYLGRLGTFHRLFWLAIISGTHTARPTATSYGLDSTPPELYALGLRLVAQATSHCKLIELELRKVINTLQVYRIRTQNHVQTLLLKRRIFSLVARHLHWYIACATFSIPGQRDTVSDLKMKIDKAVPKTLQNYTRIPSYQEWPYRPLYVFTQTIIEDR
jgi:hypothetical protein